MQYVKFCLFCNSPFHKTQRQMLYIVFAFFSTSDALLYFSLKKFFFKDFIYLFLERGRKAVREGGKHQCVVVSYVPPLGTQPTTQACPLDWEWNQRPFDSQACAQSTEPHQPGLLYILKHVFVSFLTCRIFFKSKYSLFPDYFQT